MGVVDDILIIGVIVSQIRFNVYWFQILIWQKQKDEIVRKKAQPPKPRPRTKKERARDARQHAITRFLSPNNMPKVSNTNSTSGSETSETSHPPQYTLCLLDNKSRSLPCIPTERDRISSRLQLMLYKRLLENLLKPSSFLQTLQKYSVNIHASFSPKFLQAQELLCVSNDLSEVTRNAMCLADLIIAFNDAVSELYLLLPHPEESSSIPSSPIENELILVYRTRRPDDDFDPGPRKRVRRNGRRGLLERSGNSYGNVLEADARERSLESDLGLQSPAVPVELDSSSSGDPATPLSTIQELATTTAEENVEMNTTIIPEAEGTTASVTDLEQGK